MRMKLYIRQAVYLLKENKLLSAISILGTALAIAMMMVVVLSLRAEVEPLAPESHRDRMLLSRYVRILDKEHPGWVSSGPLAYQTVKACFKECSIPEAVTVTKMEAENMQAMLPAGEMQSCVTLQTDEAFWQVFDFSFVAGKPYDRADFDAGATKAVVTTDLARRLFGSTEVVGKTFLLNHVPYLICGVVKPVSKLARYAYAQVWIPFSSTQSIHFNWGGDRIMGLMIVMILAHSSADFPAIRQEVEHRVSSFMSHHPKYELQLMEQPDTYFASLQRHSSNEGPQVKEAIRQYVIILLVLLLVPAINLSGLTLSRMRKRLSEMGLRKAFGASRKELMIQILSENMFYSLLGGLLGLVLSYVAVLLLGKMLFSVDFMTEGVGDWQTMCVNLLFDPSVLGWAFLACFLLNLLSAAIPAWRVTRTQIVEALNKR